jgi:hypothetical protein
VSTRRVVLVGAVPSVVSTGNGLGILVLAPLTRWLISACDWRVA